MSENGHDAEDLTYSVLKKSGYAPSTPLDFDQMPVALVDVREPAGATQSTSNDQGPNVGELTEATQSTSNNQELQVTMQPR